LRRAANLSVLVLGIFRQLQFCPRAPHINAVPPALASQMHRGCPVYAALADQDQAMAWLEKVDAERFSQWVLMRPAFDPLLPNLRFQDLLRRIGLRRGARVRNRHLEIQARGLR
jgi:hypothetical protein